MATDCGELVSEAAPTLDPNNVVIGQCGQDFPVQGSPGETRDVRVIVTNTNDVAAAVTVDLLADDGSGPQRIGQASDTVAAGSNQTILVTSTIPPEGRYAVSAEKASVTAAATAHTSTERASVAGPGRSVRAGASAGMDGGGRTATDGGVEQSTVSARTALTRACGGCAERSRKLSTTNRRLRDAFNLLGA